MDNEIIERAAEAILKIESPDRDYISLNKFGKEYYNSLAVAVIKAMREPTDNMVAAIHDCYPDIPDKYAYQVAKLKIQSMIKAILE